MATVEGQKTFVIENESGTLEERVTVVAAEFEIESEVTDRDDDKLRESVHMRKTVELDEPNALASTLASTRICFTTCSALTSSARRSASQVSPMDTK